MAGREGGPVRRKLRLTFLSSFLDDEEVRDVGSDPRKFDGPCAGFQFPRLEVRDLVAIQMAWVLQIPAEPKPGWGDDEWAKLRAQVRDRLNP